MQLSVMMSMMFVLLVFIQVLIMLKLHGNPREKTPMKFLRNLHRILGYIFLAYFLLMMVVMINRISEVSAEFSPRIVVHMVLALMIFPLFVIKILIARFFKRLFPNQFMLGLAIFILFFTLVAITGGYNLVRGAESPSERDAEKVRAEQGNQQDLNISGPFRVRLKELVQKKCTICHNLKRVKRARKTREQWQATVEKMIRFNINTDFLSETEKDLIISYLSSGWKKDL